jgi:hypothetical protein
MARGSQILRYDVVYYGRRFPNFHEISSSIFMVVLHDKRSHEPGPVEG